MNRKYKMEDLLVGYENYSHSEEDLEWLNAKPVGKEWGSKEDDEENPYEGCLPLDELD